MARTAVTTLSRMSGAVLIVLVLVALMAVTLWAFIDAQLQPSYSWADAGISQGVTTAVLLVTCGFGAAYYFAMVRPRLARSRHGANG
jgi:sterol desaturase/sphingolipid hydroxylase (fatty acid hydroxylase superfamily)